MLLYFKFLYSLSIDKVLFSFLYFILENDKIKPEFGVHPSKWVVKNRNSSEKSEL